MPAKKHHIRLSDEERQQLETIINKGKSSAHRQRHARILFLADLNGEHGGKMDAEIAAAAQVSVVGVERVRRICVKHGLDHALTPRKAARTYTRKLDGKAEAILVAQCCAEPPTGYARWTLRLLADRLVELEVVDSICRETVRTTLERNELKPWQKRQWVIPPEASCEFVAAMEDVLDVYAHGISFSGVASGKLTRRLKPHSVRGVPLRASTRLTLRNRRIILGMHSCDCVLNRK